MSFLPRSHAGLAPWIVTRIAGPHGIGRWQNRALRAPAVAVIVLALVGPFSVGQARASKLHRLASSVTSFASDGARYAAWQVHEGGPLSVLDTLTGRRGAETLPAGCKLQGEDGENYSDWAAAGGRFLLECSSGRDELFSVTGGESLTLPGGFSWLRVGTHYVQGMHETGGAPRFVYDLATGKLSTIRGTENAVDLNRATMPARIAICSALRSRVRADEGFEFLGDLFGYEHGVFAGDYGKHGEVQITHCNGHSVILEGEFVRGGHLATVAKPHDFDLRGGLVSWDTGEESDVGEPTEARERSFGATLATGARHHWSLPRVTVQGDEGPVTGAFGYSTHTSNTVFWIASRTLSCDKTCWPATTAVYGARL